jgi:CubicO group peptidase (beta-lactamase class C family)
MQRLSRWARTFLILAIPSLSYAQPTDWQAEVEQEAAQLDRLHTLIVAHKGEEILALDLRGQGLDTPVNIKSLSKTVLAALVGMGIKNDVLEGTDQPVVEALGNRVPASATEGVERITLGHLLSLQAGLQRTSGGNYGPWVASNNWVSHVLTRPFVDEPGGRMLYSSGSSHLLSAA